MTINETTYKKSKWTVYGQGAAGGKRLAPWQFIIIQAPLGVADDVMRNYFKLDPHHVTCQHCGADWNIYEDVDDPSYLFNFASTSSLFTVRHDAIPYCVGGIWPTVEWESKSNA